MVSILQKTLRMNKYLGSINLFVQQLSGLERIIGCKDEQKNRTIYKKQHIII